MTRLLVWQRATIAMLAVGVVLRVVQWAASPSLWLDELMLVGNILDRSPWQLLTEGLDANQVAPVGYLLLTKLTVLMFGDGERALRLVPVAGSVLSLVLFWRLARGLFDHAGAFVATTAFALNPLLISLSSVVKQYGTDVLATVLILTACRSLWTGHRSTRSRTWIAAGAGTVGFLSIPSVMVAAPAAGALLLHRWASDGPRGGGSGWQRAAPLLAWGAVAGVAALWSVAVLPAETSDVMAGFWQSYGAFAPSLWDYPTWILDHWGGTVLAGVMMKPYVGILGRVGEALNGFVGAYVLLAALILSAIAAVRLHGPAWAGALLLPFVAALILSALHVYPMDERTSAFLVPLLLLLIVASVSLPTRALTGAARGLGPVVMMVVPVLCTAIVIERPPVYVVQREREVVRELARRRQSGQPVLVDRRARPAMEYYGARFGVGEGLRFMDHYMPRDFAAIDELRGESSVWVLFTHSDNDARDLLLCYLDRNGREAERLVLVGGIPRNPVSLHRYDLSDETGWSDVDPTSFLGSDAPFDGTAAPCRRQPWSAGTG